MLGHILEISVAHMCQLLYLGLERGCAKKDISMFICEKCLSK